MSLLDNLLGDQGQDSNAGGAGAASMMAVLGQLVQKAGGVKGLLSMLQQHGLGGAVQSWVGNGSNEPVSGEQLGQALQSGGLGSLVQEAAGKLGMDQNDLMGKLSQVLPSTVDHLTPSGEMPAEGEGADGGFDLGMLGGLAGKLLG